MGGLAAWGMIHSSPSRPKASGGPFGCSLIFECRVCVCVCVCVYGGVGSDPKDRRSPCASPQMGKEGRVGQAGIRDTCQVRPVLASRMKTFH